MFLLRVKYRNWHSEMLMLSGGPLGTWLGDNLTGNAQRCQRSKKTDRCYVLSMFQNLNHKIKKKKKKKKKKHKKSDNWSNHLKSMFFFVVLLFKFLLSHTFRPEIGHCGGPQGGSAKGPPRGWSLSLQQLTSPRPNTKSFSEFFQ